MKNIYIVFAMVTTLFISSCELDLENPNAATDEVVLKTKDGLIALAVGIRGKYSTSALSPALLTPSVTTRETAITTTFANLEELEEGGSKLSGENGYTNRLFGNLMQVKGMTEDLLDNIDNVDMDAGTKSGLKAWGAMYRALCLEQLANNFTHVALRNSRDNNAAYSTREEAYEEAIRILSSALNELQQSPVNAEFTSRVSSDIDITNACQALLARNQLFTGNYAEAIIAASSVDASSTSYFTFDDSNQNPVFSNMFTGTISYAPRDRFGLPESLEIDENDMRIAYFLAQDSTLSLNNLPIETMAAPIFGGLTASIPVYRPGEMDLIIAEAYARTGEIDAAEAKLNELLQRTPDESSIGLGAGLTEIFTANGDVENLLAEIYKNRRIELYLTGMSLEDSRRFNRQAPSSATDFSTERNRNFYPFPLNERDNNPNTPQDPTL